MPILLQSNINQHDLSVNQDAIYVYLDNEQKKGGSDYAILMRNYSNAVGLIVKEKPSSTQKGGIVVLTCNWSDDENLEKYSYKTYDYLLESIGELRMRYSKSIDS